jgi:PAS domain S-box-containing protein
MKEVQVSVKTKVYVGLMIAAGAVALGHGLSLWNPQHLTRFLCYLLLAIPASCLKVRLPGITGTMSVLFVFLLAGIVGLSLPETLVMGAICISAQCLWHARLRPRPIQILFNVATISIAITVTDICYRSPLALVPFLQTPSRLAIAASAFFLTNTLPVAVVIAFTEQKSLRHVWSSCYLWFFPYYLVGAAIVGAFSFADRTLDWQAWILILPVVYIIYRCYRLYLNQFETERARAAEAHEHANEVAVLHARAVEGLSSTMSANAKLDAVIQSSPLAIMAVDLQGNVASWNRMAEQVFGWSPEEVVGRPLPFGGERSEEIIRDLINGALHGDFISGTEMTQWRKDGSPFEATVWTAALRDSAHDISSVLFTVADITDRKRLEEQLHLSSKMEAVGRLAGGIAHDFNNLLTVINGYSYMLAESVAGNPEAVSQVEEILGAGTRAAELVSQLLSFGRRQMIKPRPLEVVQFIRNVERMLRRIIGEHIEFRTELDSQAGWFHADLNQMEGVLLNLATNARDAMPDGGILSISTSRVDIVADRLRPELDIPVGSYVRIVVKDTGCGMNSETQQHLFEPFFTTKQIGKGTGLGMSSVYGGVAQNGGRIFVSSELGQGTTFFIYLPRTECPNSVEQRRSPSRSLSQGTETILLVEDESAVRRMLRDALSKVGYRVWEAENGAEAIARWGQQIKDIDMLVTDIVMPVMNGLRLADELRDRRPNLKVLFISGHSEDLIKRPDPAPDVLQKPFLPDVLVRKVREILDQSPQRVRTAPSIAPARARHASSHLGG